MQSYSRFVGIVANARKLDETALRNGVADGRILSGEDAYKAKLVDGLGYIEGVYDRAAELAGVPDAQVVRYKRRVSFSDIFSLFSEARTPSLKVDLGLPMQHLRPGRAYLLPAVYAP